MATIRLNINIHTSLHLLLIVFHIWLVFKQGDFLAIFLLCTVPYFIQHCLVSATPQIPRYTRMLRTFIEFLNFLILTIENFTA